jgi:mannosyltransferase
VTTFAGSQRRWSGLLLVVLAVAAALRVFHLGHQSLWIDEARTVEAMKVPLAELPRTLAPRNHGLPLFYALTRVPVTLAGSGEASLRSVSAVAGALAVFPIYALGARLLTPGAGLAAAGLLAISPLHVWYSQEARPYALLVLLAAWSTACLAAAAEGSRSWLWYAVSLTLALYTHFLALVLVAAHLAAVPFLRRAVRPALGSIGAALLAFVPGAVACFGGATAAALSETARGATGFSDLARAWSLQVAYGAYTLAAGLSLGPSSRELHALSAREILAEHVPAMAWVLAALAVVGVLGAATLRRRRDAAAILLPWMALPVLAVPPACALTGITFFPRYATIALPAFCLVAAAPGGTLRPGGLTTLAALAVLSLVALGNHYWNPAYAKEDLRSAGAFLTRATQREEVVLVSASHVTVPLALYAPGVALKPVATESGSDVRENLRALDGRARVWLVLARVHDPKVRERLRAALESRYRLTEERRWPGVDLLTFAAR